MTITRDGLVERFSGLAGGKSAGALTINGFGTSITAQSPYYTFTSAPAGVNAWLPNMAYVVGNVVYNVQTYNAYRCTTSGTSASSGGPTGLGSGISDGTAVWAFIPNFAMKWDTSYLAQAERQSNGRLIFDMTQGYQGTTSYGLMKVIVIDGGSNYAANDTISFTFGAKGTLQISNGKITGVVITSPGYNPAGFTPTINTSTGSGASLSLVFYPSGTFGVPGCSTTDMVARIPDAIASTVDIMVVEGGTNDIANSVTTFANAATVANTIIANLITCYEAMMSAGKKVIAPLITPRHNFSYSQAMAFHRVNRGIRSYVRKQANNPRFYNNIAIADPGAYMADGTSVTSTAANIEPIGGAGGTAGAMTQDGVHPSNRAAMYWGAEILRASEQWIGPSPAYGLRTYFVTDGYDATLNPNGNFFESLPWLASQLYTVGQTVQNGVNRYICTVGGTSASSGGPTGTGAGITDGGVTWNFLKAAGMSLFASGTAGTINAISGVTLTGNLATGYSFSKGAGSGATGTINFAIENPWSNGQISQRQVMNASLGGGGPANDQYAMTAFFNAYATTGILAADLGVTKWIAEAEIEVSGVNNALGVLLNAQFDSSQQAQCGVNLAGAGEHMMASSGEMIPIPNSGKMYLSTPPFILSPNLVTQVNQLIFWFDSSGGAGSATLTAKMNYMGMRRY